MVHSPVEHKRVLGYGHWITANWALYRCILHPTPAQQRIRKGVLLFGNGFLFWSVILRYLPIQSGCFSSMWGLKLDVDEADIQTVSVRCGGHSLHTVVRIFFVPIRICDDDLIKLQMLKRSGFGSTVVSSVPLPHLMAAIHSGKERSVFWVLLKKFLFGSNFIENMNAVHEDIHFSVKNVCRIA